MRSQHHTVASDQFEIAVPVLFEEQSGRAWSRGLGDVAVAFKHALFHGLPRGSILSVAGELILPTGKESEGLGNGVTVFESFVAVGQLLPCGRIYPAASRLRAARLMPITPTERRSGGAVVGKTLTQGRFGGRAVLRGRSEVTDDMVVAALARPPIATGAVLMGRPKR